MDLNKKKYNTTQVNTVNNIPFITFERLNGIDNIVNAFSTKKGGVSKGIYSEMNLSFTVGDDNRNVLKNFKNFAGAIGVDIKDMIYSHQTHTVNVKRVDGSHKGMGILRERDFSDVDGLITNEKGLCLVTSYADCVPLYFVDEKNSAIGLSHSGWRGTVNNMAAKTLEAMKKEFGTNAEDVVVAVGPSICQDCYEVSEDLYTEFLKNYSDAEMKEMFIKNDSGKYQLDLWKANYFNFINAGVKKENIEITDVCTCCNSDNLFSHRATKGKRGALCAFLYMKP